MPLYLRSVHWEEGEIILEIIYPNRIIYGEDTRLRTGEILADMYSSHPVIVTSAQCDRNKDISDSISDWTRGISVYNYTGEPTLDDVKNLSNFYIDNKGDSIVAIGGGSRMDLCKAARAMINSSSIGWMDEGYIVTRESMISAPNIICIPTTSGSGSEVSRGTVIHDGYRKRVIGGPGMLPNASILDPLMTTTMSKELTASTAIDALSHTLESYLGINNNFIVDGMCEQAYSLIYNNCFRS